LQCASDSDMEAICGNLGGASNTMKAGMAADAGQSSRSKPVITGGVVASFLGWFAEIGRAAKHLLRLRHPASAENRAESAVAEAGVAHAVTDNTNAKPTTTKSCAIALTADVNVGPMGINSVGQTVADEQEIERRRNLVSFSTIFGAGLTTSRQPSWSGLSRLKTI
jgi:hypothetical protein